jgi:hypothetical protein
MALTLFCSVDAAMVTQLEFIVKSGVGARMPVPMPTGAAVFGVRR